MDLQKAKRLLGKINALYGGMEADYDGISEIEKDLMKSYIRQFYDVFLDNHTSAPAPRRTSAPATAPVPRPTAPPPPAKPRVIELSEEVKEFIADNPAPAPPPQPAPTPPPAPASRPPQPAPATVDLAGSEEVLELFQEHKVTDLSEKLSSMPVNDLMKTMGLNERILTVNELFGGDANAFKKIMTDLNNLDSFEAAKQYLAANVVEKYGWTKRNKKNKAKTLIKTIRRRYA